MGGVVALTACSDEVYTDVETTEEDMYSTNSFNDDKPGFAFGDSDGSGNIWAGENYASPWDFNLRTLPGKQPAYVMVNGNEENYSPYTLEIFAHVGLAYFDGLNDGSYDDPFTGNSSPIGNGGFPNLWDGTKEVGNLVRIPVPFDLSPGDSSIRLEAMFDHLPVFNSTTTNIPSDPNYVAYPDVFNFANSVNAQEEELLKEYGKVFFYEVNVWEIGNFIGTYLMHPYIETVQPNANIPTQMGGLWHEVTDLGSQPLTGLAPDGNDYPLYFYWNQSWGNGTVYDYQQGIIGGELCDSREVVFQIPPDMHSYTLPNGQHLNMYILQNSRYLWLNSMVVVGIE